MSRKINHLIDPLRVDPMSKVDRSIYKKGLMRRFYPCKPFDSRICAPKLAARFGFIERLEFVSASVR